MILDILEFVLDVGRPCDSSLDDWNFCIIFKQLISVIEKALCYETTWNSWLIHVRKVYAIDIFLLVVP